MNELKVNIPVGWMKVSSDDNEEVICKFSGDRTIIARIKLVSYSGRVKDLKSVFRSQIGEQVIVLDSSHSQFMHQNVTWYVDSYICKNTSERYRYFYYAVLDNMYLAIEMMTNDDCSALRFNDESRILMQSVDYSVIDMENSIIINGNSYRVRTPSGYRFSLLSKDDHLLYIGEFGYLLVNTLLEGSLRDCFYKQLESAEICIENCSISLLEESEDGSVFRYAIRQIDGDRILGTGTYFQQNFEGEVVTSFLFQKGSVIPEIDRLLEFRNEV